MTHIHVSPLESSRLRKAMGLDDQLSSKDTVDLEYSDDVVKLTVCSLEDMQHRILITSPQSVIYSVVNAKKEESNTWTRTYANGELTHSNQKWTFGEGPVENPKISKPEHYKKLTDFLDTKVERVNDALEAMWAQRRNDPRPTAAELRELSRGIEEAEHFDTAMSSIEEAALFLEEMDDFPDTEKRPSARNRRAVRENNLGS